ncbi:MAG: PAS domain S-box protein [Deltaproteobacteria bacterium]|nr:PAS domain S-box protein [Deltaproteobacteria bacterium]
MARSLLAALETAGQAAAWVMDGRVRAANRPWTSAVLAATPQDDWLAHFAPELRARLQQAAASLGEERVEVGAGAGFELASVVLTPVPGAGFVCQEVAAAGTQTLFNEVERQANLGSWDWNLTTGKVFWSAGMYRLYGLPDSYEPSFTSYVSLLHPDDRAEFQANAHRVLAAKEAFDSRLRIVRPDGSMRLIQDRGRVLVNRAGEPSHVVGISRDITDEQHHVATLQRYKELVDATPDAFISSSPDGIVQMWSRGTEQLFGVPEAAALGRPLEAFMRPEQRPEFRRRFQHVLSTGEPHLNAEIVRDVPGGPRVELVASLLPVRDARGQVHAVVSLLRNVTAFRQAEREARANEESRAALFALGPAAMAVLDAKTLRLLDVNPSFCELYALRREDVLGKRPSDRGLVLSDPAQERMVLEAIAAGTSARNLILKVGTPSGRVLEVLASFGAIQHCGQPAVLWAVQDISAQRESEARFQQAFRFSPVALCITALDTGQLRDVNDVFCRLLELSREALIGETATALGLWDDPPERLRWVARITEQGAVGKSEVRLRTRSGRAAVATGFATVIELNGERCVLSALVELGDEGANRASPPAARRPDTPASSK